MGDEADYKCFCTGANIIWAAMRKRVLWHMQTAKAEISLRIRKAFTVCLQNHWILQIVQTVR